MKLALFFLVFALLVCDVVTTIMVIERGGYEANPVLARLFKRLGLLNGLLLTKGVYLAGLIYFYELLPIYAFGLIAALYFWVLWNNVSEYRK